MKGSTLEVFEKALKGHASFGLDGGVVEVGVEHDDGKGEQEDGVFRAD